MSAELRALRVTSGGDGALIVVAVTSGGDGAIVAPEGPRGTRWVSAEASEALMRAAHSLGFGPHEPDEVGRGWLAVTDAIVAGCWVDLLSEAIEQEDYHGQG